MRFTITKQNITARINIVIARLDMIMTVIISKRFTIPFKLMLPHILMSICM